MATKNKQTIEESNDNRLTFVVPSNGGASNLREFTDKVTETFGARILKTVGTEKETLITVERDKTITAADMLDELVNMHEVERVEGYPYSNKRMGEPQRVLVILAH